jgi:uncharacterized damage-inducible protein DinB
MQKNDILLLFNYNYWANARVLKACSELPPQSLISPVQVSFRSVLGTLAHILATEVVWRSRLQEGISPERMLGGEDFSSFADLVTRWKALSHVAIHGAQFRSEAGAALAGLGKSPGDLDFIVYLREINDQ